MMARMTQRKVKTKAHVVKKLKTLEKCDWTTLVPGDVIKCIGGGPYWLTKDSVKISFGYRGKFKINHVMPTGILAWGIQSGEGCSFIYMGDDAISKAGTRLHKHTIRKVISHGEKEGA